MTSANILEAFSAYILLLLPYVLFVILFAPCQCFGMYFLMSYIFSQLNALSFNSYTIFMYKPIPYPSYSLTAKVQKNYLEY